MIIHLLDFNSAMYRNVFHGRKRYVFTYQDTSSLKIDLPATIHVKVNNQYMEIMFMIAFSAEHKADI